jgi:hypothetical protein
MEISALSWEFADSQSIRLLPPGNQFASFEIYELWYEATGSKVLGIGFATVRGLVSYLRYETADRNGAPNPIIAEGARTEGTGISHGARLWRLAERAFSAPFPRARHERRRARAARLRRCDEPRRRRRQGVRQPPLRHAGGAPRPSTRTASIRRTGSRSATPLRPIRSRARPGPFSGAIRPTRWSSRPTARPSIGRRALRWCTPIRPAAMTPICHRMSGST